VTRVGRDPFEPTAHGGIGLELEAALFRHVRVRIQRDVRQRQSVADEELPAVEMALDR